jgi:hypothetical protein
VRFSSCLGCLGYALIGERVVGELEGTIEKLYSFENMELCVSYGVFEESGTQGALKIVNMDCKS